jgi:hypothetical protein
MTKLSARRPHQCRCSVCLLHPRGRTAREHRLINRLAWTADERQRRLLVGFLAGQHGRGGVSLLSRVTGLSRTTVLRGRRELLRPTAVPPRRRRRPGGGRKPAELAHPKS